MCQYNLTSLIEKLDNPHMDTTTLDLEKMKTSAGQACRLMKVLSNPDRLTLLCQLSQGEKRVGELEEILGIVQPTLSQQLTVLRDEELVSTRREGKNIYYQIASPQALAVMKVLFDQFCEPQEGASA
jgi:DNA-binding transcriptional ArsR family regulator